MKILYAITKGNWGGAQHYLFDLAYACRKQNNVVSVLTGIPGKLNENLVKENIETFSIDSLNRDVRILKEIESFFKIFKFIAGTKPDVIHLNSPKMGAMGALAARL